MTESIPHFSTFVKNYARRFEGTDLFEDIFETVVNEIIKCDFIDIESIFIDGTHIKACANNKKAETQVVEQSIRFYEEELQKEITKDRETHGKSL